ncbi:alpha/beta hydrolase [Dyella sp.]|uniref:alpha/beta fold hydrolase n=1 Tax=Dyella sp. TaxID=1869338 RepID=UPI002ED3EF15
MNHPMLELPAGAIHLSLDRKGSGRPLLLLHGGAGPDSMRPMFNALNGFELILPTHPGFDATEHPSWMRTIADLADCYIELLNVLKLRDVIVVGNSVGGWIAAEMAIRQSSAVAGIVLINAVGLKPDDSTGPIMDPRSLPPEELIKFSFANPARVPLPSPEAAARRQANQRELMSYAGEPFMHDPTLAARLSSIAVPSCVLWGHHDRIVTAAYGRDYARHISGTLFKLIEDAGHLPQVEQPERTAEAVQDFCASLAGTVSPAMGHKQPQS